MPATSALIPGSGQPTPRQTEQKGDRIVTLDEARDALARSGYLLESRLEGLLRKKGFYVETNVAYPDKDSGKAREFDVYGMSAFPAGKGEFDFAFEVLLIECINNPQPVAFITKTPQVTERLHWRKKEALSLNSTRRSSTGSSVCPNM